MCDVMCDVSHLIMSDGGKTSCRTGKGIIYVEDVSTGAGRRLVMDGPVISERECVSKR